MRCLTAFTLSMVLLSGISRAGTIILRDGKTFSGDMTLGDEGIGVRVKGEQNERNFSFKEIASANFAPPVSAVAPVYGKAGRSRRTIEPTRLFVEYFADPEMKDRRLARYESQVISSWDTRAPPDPAIPARVYIRYSGMLLPKSSEDYTFTSDVEGQVKLWIGGELKIERATEHHSGNQARTTVALKANQPVAFKMEIVPGRYSVYSRLSWSSRSVGQTWVPAAAFVLTADSVKAPEVRIASPAEGTDFRDASSIPLDVQAEKGAGRIASVDLLEGSAVIGSMKNPPYRFEWKSPAQGLHKIRARAIDERGVSAYSEAIEISVGDTGENNSLPAPWANQSLGKKAERIVGKASFANGVFKISKAGGQITEEDDSPEFVYQAVSGDFEVSVHLAELTQNENRVGPLAGLMIRENMTSLDRFAALLVGPGATVIARRQDYWGRTASGERMEQAAEWLKLGRHGTRIRAYTSADGTKWSLMGGVHIDLPERVFVGMCNMTRDKETPAVATFDHVAISLGPPAMTYAAAGILFRSGSFLACDVLGFGKDGALAYDRRGERHYAPNPDVARLIYKPVIAELGQGLSAGHTGVLVGSGDFIEGDLKEITWRVTVSNIIFGPRTMNLKGGDVLAVCIKDADAPSEHLVITATDGSVYQCKSIKTSKDSISLQDPSVGAVELSLKELAQIKVN